MNNESIIAIAAIGVEFLIVPLVVYLWHRLEATHRVVKDLRDSQSFSVSNE